MPTLPGIPTLSESGAPGFDVSSWNGLYVPRGTASDRVDVMAANLANALGDEALQVKFKSLGAVVRSTPARELNARMHSEIKKWSEVIEAAGIEKQ